ncbi:hypothetical protein [Phascolarctobacterium succinatutens]|uniref:hypothetical protein n=1 Tax=Phascolarctobacterium succinatutens TaxID=626940 RepID=UPI0025F3CA05|nr:hypothetical protein [Phascolarctobacterium succinatutens]
MSKNLIPQIAHMLGVELGEEFKVKGYDELIYRLTNDGLKLTHDSGIELADVSAKVAFADLLNGKDEIIKLPWKPKAGEQYYSFGGRFFGDPTVWIVVDVIWQGLAYDVAMFDKGWVYRTKEEAQAALPKVAAELGVEYEL